MISDYPIPFYIRFFRSLIGKQKTSVSGRLQGFSLPLALQYRLWDSSAPYTNLCALAPKACNNQYMEQSHNWQGIHMCPRTMKMKVRVLPAPYSPPPRRVEHTSIFLYSPVFSHPGTVTTLKEAYTIHFVFPALIQVRQTNPKEVQYYEQNEDSCNIC